MMRIGVLRIMIDGIPVTIEDAREGLGCAIPGRVYLSLPDDCPVGRLTRTIDGFRRNLGIPNGVQVGNEDSDFTSDGVFVPS